MSGPGRAGSAWCEGESWRSTCSERLSPPDEAGRNSQGAERMAGLTRQQLGSAAGRFRSTVSESGSVREAQDTGRRAAHDGRQVSAADERALLLDPGARLAVSAEPVLERHVGPPEELRGAD